jgi:hypothetical protein
MMVVAMVVVAMLLVVMVVVREQHCQSKQRQPKNQIHSFARLKSRCQYSSYDRSFARLI